MPKPHHSEKAKLIIPLSQSQQEKETLGGNSRKSYDAARTKQMDGELVGTERAWAAPRFGSRGEAPPIPSVPGDDGEQ